MNSIDRERMARQCRAHLAKMAAIEEERRLLDEDLAIARMLRGEPMSRAEIKRDTIAAALFMLYAAGFIAGLLVIAALAVLAWQVCGWGWFYV